MGTVDMMDTAGTGLPRPERNADDNAKLAGLPAEKSPFGLFGKLGAASSPRSREGSAKLGSREREQDLSMHILKLEQASTVSHFLPAEWLNNSLCTFFDSSLTLIIWMTLR